MAKSMQDIMLKIIERTQFNSFEGRSICQSLRLHRDLWRAVMLTRTDPGIILRDLSDNHYNADTLLILTWPDQELALRELVATWHPDAVSGVSNPSSFLMVSPTPHVVLSCWWD